MAAFTLRLSFVAGHKWNVCSNPCILLAHWHSKQCKKMTLREASITAATGRRRRKMALIDTSNITLNDATKYRENHKSVGAAIARYSNKVPYIQDAITYVHNTHVHEILLPAVQMLYLRVLRRQISSTDFSYGKIREINNPKISDRESLRVSLATSRG